MMTSFLAGEAVGRQTAQGTQREDGDLGAEPGCAKQQLRVCQTVDKPALGDVLHPRADQRNDLPADEQAEIAVTQRAEGVRQLPECRRLGSDRGQRLFPRLYVAAPPSSSRIMRGTMGDQSNLLTGEIFWRKISCLKRSTWAAALS